MSNITGTIFRIVWMLPVGLIGFWGLWFLPLHYLFFAFTAVVGLAIAYVTCTSFYSSISRLFVKEIGWRKLGSSISRELGSRFSGLIVFVRSYFWKKVVVIDFIKGTSLAVGLVLLGYIIPTDPTIRFGGNGDVSAERLLFSFGFLFVILGQIQARDRD